MIEATRGCLVEFIGDAILAIWNAPIHAPRHAVHGADAALEMRAALARLRARWAARGWPKVGTAPSKDCLVVRGINKHAIGRITSFFTTKNPPSDGRARSDHLARCHFATSSD